VTSSWLATRQGAWLFDAGKVPACHLLIIAKRAGHDEHQLRFALSRRSVCRVGPCHRGFSQDLAGAPFVAMPVYDLRAAPQPDSLTDIIGVHRGSDLSFAWNSRSDLDVSTCSILLQVSKPAMMRAFHKGDGTFWKERVLHASRQPDRWYSLSPFASHFDPRRSETPSFLHGAAQLCL
jgi:hypothetical protein